MTKNNSRIDALISKVNRETNLTIVPAGDGSIYQWLLGNVRSKKDVWLDSPEEALVDFVIFACSQISQLDEEAENDA